MGRQDLRSMARFAVKSRRRLQNVTPVADLGDGDSAQPGFDDDSGTALLAGRWPGFGAAGLVPNGLLICRGPAGIVPTCWSRHPNGLPRANEVNRGDRKARAATPVLGTAGPLWRFSDPQIAKQKGGCGGRDGRVAVGNPGHSAHAGTGGRPGAPGGTGPRERLVMPCRGCGSSWCHRPGTGPWPCACRSW